MNNYYSGDYDKISPVISELKKLGFVSENPSDKRNRGVGYNMSISSYELVNHTTKEKYKVVEKSGNSAYQSPYINKLLIEKIEYQEIVSLGKDEIKSCVGKANIKVNSLGRRIN